MNLKSPKGLFPLMCFPSDLTRTIFYFHIMVRRFRRRGGLRRARSLIRRTVSKMGPIEAKRIILDAVNIPAKSSAVYDNPLQLSLLVCQETMDEELESDGTNIATVPLYSKIVSLKANLMIHNVSANERIRWMLIKDTDNDIVTGITSALILTDSVFHTSNDSTTQRELRANTLAKGFFVASDKTAGRLSLFVKRNTLKRLGSLREGDRLKLLIATSSASVSSLTGFGTIYCRLN